MLCGGYYVFTVNRCLDVCHIVLMFRANVDLSAGWASPLHIQYATAEASYDYMQS